MNVDAGSLSATKREMRFCVRLFDRELQTSWGGGFGIDEVGRGKIGGTSWEWVCHFDIFKHHTANMFYSDLLDEYGVRLNVIGKKELLPESVQRAVRKAEDMTRHNNRYVPGLLLSSRSELTCSKSAILNLCMPYTSRDEITTAVQTCIRNANSRDSEESYGIRFITLESYEAFV